MSINKPFVEQDCTVTHAGKSFTSGGAIVTDDVIVAYVGKQSGGHRALTDWHGNIIGTIRLTSSWRVNSAFSDRMYQAYATVDGITYTGRTLGEGMSFKGKRVKA